MTLEQQAIDIITTLSADKLSQVINYAKFLLAEETDVFPYQKEKEQEVFIRRPGLLKGQVKLSEDFDETPECFKEYM